MKRYNMTLNEMLVVIAILGILAGILLPTLNYARSRSKQTSCLSNQGQTVKMIIDGIHRTKDPKEQLISAKTESGSNLLWTTSIYNRNILQSMESARCPELKYTSDDITTATARGQAYGVVFAESGKLDFRGKKLLRSTGTSPQDIPPSSLLLGGCAVKADDNDNTATAVLDFTDTKLISVHRGQVNLFFFDGSVISADEKYFGSNNFYYPVSDNSGAEKLPGSVLKD